MATLSSILNLYADENERDSKKREIRTKNCNLLVLNTINTSPVFQKRAQVFDANISMIVAK